MYIYTYVCVRACVHECIQKQKYVSEYSPKMLTVLANFLFFCDEQPFMTSVDDDAEEEGTHLLPGEEAHTSSYGRFVVVPLLCMVPSEATVLAEWYLALGTHEGGILPSATHMADPTPPLFGLTRQLFKVVTNFVQTTFWVDDHALLCSRTRGVPCGRCSRSFPCGRCSRSFPCGRWSGRRSRSFPPSRRKARVVNGFLVTIRSNRTRRTISRSMRSA